MLGITGKTHMSVSLRHLTIPRAINLPAELSAAAVITSFYVPDGPNYAHNVRYAFCTP